MPYKRIHTKHNDRFYIYRHLRNDTGTPFYIGRGSQHVYAGSYEVFYSRAFEKETRTKRWKNIVAKHGYTVEILLDDLTLEEAKAKEVELISLYGKLTTGGILVNYKDGGECDATGYKHPPEKIAEFSKNKRKSLSYHMDKYIAYEPNTGCWIWVGQFSDGFPKVNIDGKTLQAGRAIFQMLKNIKLKDKKEVLHNNCGCEHCVNPDHFIIDVSCPAEKQSRILTPDQVSEIRRLAATKKYSNAEISRMIGIGDGAVDAILIGRTWKWLKTDGVPDKIKSDYVERQKKPIICLDTGEVFSSSREAAAKLFNDETIHKSIRKICVSVAKGNQHKYKGMRFAFYNESKLPKCRKIEKKYRA